MRKSLRELALFIIKRLGVGSRQFLNVCRKCIKKVEPDWCPLTSQGAQTQEVPWEHEEMSVIVSVLEHQHGLLREVVDSPPWRSSEATWMWPWVPCCGWPCLEMTFCQTF